MDALDRGVSRRDLATFLAFTSEHVTLVVKDLYQHALGRAPDQGGLSYWVSQIAYDYAHPGQLSVAQVAGAFYASDEYFANHGATNPAWVSALYGSLLDRAPDAGGVGYWVGQSALQGRGQVALRFFQSSESARDRVTAIYQQILQRPPDPGGLNYWAMRLDATGDLDVAAYLAASPEYYASAQTRFG